jgi:hypothetical protein
MKLRECVSTFVAGFNLGTPENGDFLQKHVGVLSVPLFMCI